MFDMPALFLKKYTFLLLGLAAVRVLCAQTPDSTQVPALLVPEAAVFAAADQIGNLYLIDAQAALLKYAPDGRLTARYSNNRLGAPALVDVTNPLKILLWYPDFGTAVLLDRSLTELGLLDLNAAGYPALRLIASAQDGNLWIYDEIGFKLRKISPDGHSLYESAPLNMALEQNPAFRAIRDEGNRVLVADAAQGLLLFDVYAQFQRVLLRRTAADFQVSGNTICLLDRDFLSLTDLRSFQTRNLPLPPGALWMRLGPRCLLVRQEDGVAVFRLKY